MLRTRVIPVLLLSSRGVVKTTRFREPRYVGDPFNIVRIFNGKEVDELILSDIAASKRRGVPDFDLIEQIASEAFMPVSYGGGVATIAQARKLLHIGMERVALNSAILEEPLLVRKLADALGSQCVIASIDVERTRRGELRVFSHARRKIPERDPLRWAARLAELGCGELMINAVHRDGTMSGYDLDLLRAFSGRFDVPIIACGGAASVADMAAAVREARVSALGVGARFIYEGPYRAVLPSYLSTDDFAEISRASS